jgi:hypothetical protein
MWNDERWASRNLCGVVYMHSKLTVGYGQYIRRRSVSV